MGVWGCFNLLTFSFYFPPFCFMPSSLLFSSVSVLHSWCVAVPCWHFQQSHLESLRCHPALQGSVLLMLWVCSQNNSSVCSCRQSLLCLDFFFESWNAVVSVGISQQIIRFQFICGNSPFPYSIHLYCKVRMDLQAACLGTSHPPQEWKYPFCISSMTQQGFFIWKVQRLFSPVDILRGLCCTMRMQLPE